MKRLFVTVTCLLLAILPARAEEMHIAAVVNKDAITAFDLGNRISLAIAASNMPDTPQAREQLKAPILRMLVDEKLQTQEAARIGAAVDNLDVANAFAMVAKQNNLTSEQFAGMLAERGASKAAFEAQIKAQLLWDKVITTELRPQVSVSEEEIDEALNRIKANAGKPEFLVAEIFITPDSAGGETQARTLADRLVEEIGKGASFAALARQFSQGAGAGSTGGDLGWLQEGQLAPELDKVVQTLTPGDVSNPIHTLSGWHILFLRDKRTVSANPKDLPSRDEIANQIGYERLDLLQRRLLRDLRSAAFIDIRV